MDKTVTFKATYNCSEGKPMELIQLLDSSSIHLFPCVSSSIPLYPVMINRQEAAASWQLAVQWNIYLDIFGVSVHVIIFINWKQ